MAAMSPQFDDLPHGRAFLLNHVYVDDGLGASDSAEGAALMVREAREILSSHKIRLHKFVSNRKEVLKDFPPSEIAPLACKSVGIEEYDSHSALGILWDVTADKLSLQFSLPNCPFTKRGVLAFVNSIFDPLGIASPVVLSGRLLQREIFTGAAETKFDWDDPLPSLYAPAWNGWRESLLDLSRVVVPRSYYPSSFGPVVSREVHVFCDASQVAIGHVMYLRLLNSRGEILVSFLTGSARSPQVVPA